MFGWAKELPSLLTIQPWPEAGVGRRATGSVVLDERRKVPVYGLRFRAYGRRRYVRLGTIEEGWTHDRASIVLRHTLADVERGIWKAAEPVLVVGSEGDPTFHEFASQWFEASKGGWRPKTQVDYRWQLTDHLLPFFKDHRLSQITIAEVDRYRTTKVRESNRNAEAVAQWKTRLDLETDPARRRELRKSRPSAPLSPTSINKTITRLAQILEVALEYELIDRNPAKGKRRRVKASKPAPVWLDRAEHIAALLDGARQLDATARPDRRHVPRRAILATLVFAGLRLGELCELRWRDVDVRAGRLTVRESKTDAGVRQVDVLPVLQRELEGLPRRRPDDLVFGTANGAAYSQSNIRNRILAPAVEIADANLEQRGEVPLPKGLSPHKLRHTFASLLVALGVDPGSVMDQLGHTDPTFTLRVYRHGMRRDEASKHALRELVGVNRADANLVPVQFTAVSPLHAR